MTRAGSYRVEESQRGRKGTGLPRVGAFQKVREGRGRLSGLREALTLPKEASDPKAGKKHRSKAPGRLGAWFLWKGASPTGLVRFQRV